MKNAGADKPYYARIDARKIYGKRFFLIVCQREKKDASKKKLRKCIENSTRR